VSQNYFWIHENADKTSTDTSANHLSIPWQSRDGQGEKPKRHVLTNLWAAAWWHGLTQQLATSTTQPLTWSSPLQWDEEETEKKGKTHGLR